MLADLISSGDVEFDIRPSKPPMPDNWVQTITLPTGPFTFKNHEYQRGILTENAPRQVLKKGSQLGLSETQILKTMHGLIWGTYPQGALYLFPTEKDVYDFGRARFNPLVAGNQDIAKEVRDTESVSLKKVRRSMLYLRGARATSRIENVKAMATGLLSIPVDRIVFDERDLMSDDMIELALTRLGHSSVREEVYLGTPSLPDFGVSKLYDESDQRVWEIRCQHCGAGTVLEIEFPGCLLERADGRVIRACKKCQKEIFPRDGQWIAQHPERSKDLVGFWISRLNSSFADLKKILRSFQDPGIKNKAEFYNSTLAQAYVAAENRLNTADVFSCCGQEAMAVNHPGPCCMGVDVGRELHVAIGFKPKERQLQICHLARLTDFRDLHDLMVRFNVKCAVLDLEPELRKVREFADGEGYGRVFLCDYQDVPAGPVWDESKQLVKTHRTETCDATHDIVANGFLILPRRSEEVEIFAKQCCNTAKVLEEDPVSGSRTYKYRKLGDDHYRHALNYLWLASKRVGLAESNDPRSRMMRDLLEMQNKEEQCYSPLTFGLKTSSF
jgi:hypothetical protein